MSFSVTAGKEARDTLLRLPSPFYLLFIPPRSPSLFPMTPAAMVDCLVAPGDRAASPARLQQGGGRLQLASFPNAVQVRTKPQSCRELVCFWPGLEHRVRRGGQLDTGVALLLLLHQYLLKFGTCVIVLDYSIYSAVQTCMYFFVSSSRNICSRCRMGERERV